MKVNLFIAGACKSGTTYLHHFLGQQKDICPSLPKEPYFFELTEELRDNEEYINKYFKSYNGERFLLDGRHRTMFFKWIPKAIKDYNEDAKIIFLLRDPIDRAYSHWWMWYSRRILKTKFYKTVKNQIQDMKQGIKFMELTPNEYSEYVSKRSYQKRMTYADASTIVESGCYYDQIERFSKLFKKESILIIDYNSILKSDFLSKELSDFLGITIEQIQSKEGKNEAQKYTKINNKYSRFFPRELKQIIKNILYKKPKMSRKSEKLLKDYYFKKDLKLMESYHLEFVKKWKSQL